MKATSGNLRLDQQYTYVKCEYAGKYMPDNDPIMRIAGQCENCGKPIANIATVRGSKDGREYHIGLDCAATLTGIVPSEIAEAKKRMAREAQCRKWIASQMVSWIEIDGVVYMFEFELAGREGVDSSLIQIQYKWRGNAQKYASQLPADKRRVIVDQREVKYEFIDRARTVYTIDVA